MKPQRNPETLQFKPQKLCLGNEPYQPSVFWDEDENVVHVKCPLPSPTKREDAKVEIDEHGKLLIQISKVVGSHSDPLSSASSWMIRFGFCLLSFLKKKEGDTISQIGPMEFNLLEGLNTNDFETAVDDEGLLSLTFKKLVQRSVFWDEDENLVHFNYRLPSGTKREDVKVEIDEDGKLLITILSKVAAAQNDSSMIISSLFSFLKKKEGDTTSQIIQMEFNLPAGLNPNGFKTAIVDEGLLTLTKLKPEKKKLGPIAKKTLGCLADAALMLICGEISDAICPGDC